MNKSMIRFALRFLVATAVGCSAAPSLAQTALPAAAATPTGPTAAAVAPDYAAAVNPAADPCGHSSCGSDSSGCDSFGWGYLGLLGGQCPLNCPDQPAKRLFDHNDWLKCHNITVTGYIDAGIAGRDGSRGDGFMGPDGFDDRDGEGQLNQFDTVVAKDVKPAECCWDWGFKIETIYGTDYKYTVARGLDAFDNGDPKWNTDPRHFYGLALPQAYLEWATTKLDLKIGHWYSLLGFEVVNSNGNFFYSHTYSFINSPYTHTGILGTYTKDEYLTFNFGLDEGWDNFNDTDQNISCTGGVTVKSCDKKTTLAWFFQEGNEPYEPGAVTGPVANRYLQSIVLTKNFTDRTTFTIENFDGFQSRGERDGGTSSWFGLTEYLVYKLNCCWTTGLRAEMFRDTDGTRVYPVGDFQTPNGNTASIGGFEGNFYDITYGFNYKPNGNLTVRPEIRYDWFSGTDLNGVRPYLSRTSDHQWVYAIDAVLLF
jgi:hypothetical protein